MSSAPSPQGPARQYSRAATHGDLEISYEGWSEPIPTRVPDISPQGMFINTAREFAEGSVLKVKFRLTSSGYEVNARGEVRYCLSGVGVGVEFIEISDEARDAIQQEVSGWHR